ncbi:MAG: twin-arginine translocase subunit TatC [Candidatus Bathyarchaeia archaeon]
MSSEQPESLKSWAMSFWGHIDELVSRLKVVLVALIIGIGIGWIPTSLAGITNPVGTYQPMIAPLMVRLREEFLPRQATLIAGGMADTVFAMAYLSVIVGVLLASPVIFYEIIAFVKPALYDNEKKVLGYYLGSFLGLVTLGVAMAFFFVIPISFRILIYFTIQGGATPLIVIKDFYNWIYTIFVLCGVFYTIPIFVVMLIHVGVLPTKYVSGRNKMFVYLAILLIFWIFGPDPTPVTGAIIMAPFVAVFEVAMFFGRRIERTRKKRKEAEANGTYGATKTGFITFPKNACKFCKAPVLEDAAFCPGCRRAIK